jgi:rfaE bifunctional protein kinase chain/domain
MADIVYERYANIIDCFQKISIGVIGDIIADSFIFGQPYELSREAPVVIVKYESQKIVPGGAANTINNLRKLGAAVYPFGLVGNDDNGSVLRSYFDGQGIDTRGIVSMDGRHTITKMRVMAGGAHTSKQQVVRIDYDPLKRMDKDCEQCIIKNLESVINRLDGLIVSDYNYDLFSPAIIHYINEIAKKKLVIVDSHYRLAQFKGAAVLTPNEAETFRAVRLDYTDELDILRAGKRLMELVKPQQGILVTRGNEGMMLFENDREPLKIPIAGSDDVTDVTGAGDTVVSVLTLALLAGASLVEASYLANFAAGIVVMKSGTATTDQDELKEFIMRCLNEKTAHSC